MKNNNENNSSSNTTQIATLANGCFWCSEAIFKRLKGVKSVLPGYSGGIVKNPSYEQVCTGRTGHVESIQIEFDPKIIPYGWEVNTLNKTAKQKTIALSTVAIAAVMILFVSGPLVTNQQALAYRHYHGYHGYYHRYHGYYHGYYHRYHGYYHGYYHRHHPYHYHGHYDRHY
jgi:hypothetical protein